jgi:prolyl-tRNA synthetase
VAPFQVALVSLPGGDPDIEARADALYGTLLEAGFEVLYDDRAAGPGVKFNDADLIGAPVRITLGARSLEAGGVEWKLRTEKERSIVSIDEVVTALQRRLDTAPT